jgi:hypothetical protein
MKLLLPLALLSLSSSLFAQTSVPFYFGVTEDSMAQIADKSWKKISIKEVETQKVYLRGYHFLDSNKLTEGSVKKSPSTVVAKKKITRQAAVKELLKKGILKSGDIVLSFRTSWEKTTAYPHIQMGVSHAGVIFVEGGVARNIDMPLDADYNNSLINSSLDAPHYLETDALQIVRPRDFDAVKQKNLLSWIGTLRKNYANIRNTGLMKFNGNYMDPKFNRYGNGNQFITTMARIMNGENKTSTDLTMYCSEFAWALLSLANCTPADILADSGANAGCVEEIMKPLPMLNDGNLPGLAEGPLAVLEELEISPDEKVELTKALLYEGPVEGLSPGHRALATMPEIVKLIGLMKLMYPAKLTGAAVIPFPAPNTPITAVAAMVNGEAPRNYSPTSFLINAMLDSNHPERKFDYVATVFFTDKL